MNTVDLGASTSSLSEAIIYPWIAQPPDGRPRSLSCQLPGPPLQWQLLVDDEVSSAKSPGNSPRNSFSSTGSVASQASSSKDNRSEHGSQGSRAGLGKLARFLTSRDKSVASDRPASHGSDSSLAPDIASLRKANSIDSLLESSSSGYNLDSIAQNGGVSPVTPGSSGKPLPASPSVPAKLESHKKGNGSSTSPTVSKHSKGSRQGSLERIIDSSPLTKAERKKLEKYNKFNIDLQALFAAVEHKQLDRARGILETTNVDVNSVNADGFTPLDLAVMTTNVAMVQLLQSHGAAESPKFPCRETRSNQLQTLVREAGRCVEDLGTCVLSAATNGSLSAALLKEKERQLSLWQRRHQLLKRMKTGFDHLRPPDPPSSVQLEVVGNRSLKVKFCAPETAYQESSIVTKYKVEWSCYEDFSLLAGSREISDVQKLELMIPDLTQGSTYFVRVAAGNVKGFSSWRSASPLSATPSSWRDVEGKVPRSSGRLGKLDDLFHQIINSRSGHASEIKDLSETPQQQRRQVRKSIKHLFTSAPKFQKNMKRGVFLACLLYHEDRIIVTAEDTLPILEVDETYPSPLHTDFHWLMKVACTWEDVKTLRQDMEKSHSSSNVHFRSKLLQAAEQMQSALGLQDLGQLYYLPLKDSEGTTVLCTVKHIQDPKTMVTLSVRWLPLYKIQRKRANNSDSNGDNPGVNDLLLDSLQEMILYSQVSNKPLSRGLYVGYMKLKSSVDAIRVVVPRLIPNVLPHAKIRDNPHVSCEEWQWFKSLASGSLPVGPTEIQMKFQKALSLATKQLLTELDIPENVIDLHRYYDVEVIELSENVSFLLVLPPVDSVCSVPGQCDEITSRPDCIPLPIQIFEMIHMTTYQPNFIMRYSRLSSILEMDNMLAHHAHREAFSSTELSEAKSRLNQLQEFQSQVDNMWRAIRWIMDVLTFARDKQGSNGVLLKDIWTNASSPDSPRINSPEQVKEVTESTRTSPAPSMRLLDTEKRQIRRCSSTSRLQISRTDLAVDIMNCKAHSAERLGDSTSRSSIRSSFAGSLKSFSSVDIAVDPKEHFSSNDDELDRVDVAETSSRPSSPVAESESEIRVYADYETGLASGYSVKLSVNRLTTARDIVETIVKQMNTGVMVKGKQGPIYDESQFHTFCLVVTVGARERCLSDDFHPLELQGPWLKGKLSVRRKSTPFNNGAD
ncbi:ankyrin repeat and fibronectin type-III domain-containing protein 1-like isoform X3 [Argiope bruennichi]|uniref:ankyrin repeat and fibronectin type-III domain-containing protein 1-like isoform X3 n=1 Tax=Argiope bruennichi TaxID=94029 RepID=UPI0024941F2D|nr:ankyrin repeat and fibronectin type-III domain-containing protein 1-like isoform X3 [Argiope bruennichi]